VGRTELLGSLHFNVPNTFIRNYIPLVLYNEDVRMTSSWDFGSFLLSFGALFCCCGRDYQCKTEKSQASERCAPPCKHFLSRKALLSVFKKMKTIVRDIAYRSECDIAEVTSGSVAEVTHRSAAEVAHFFPMGVTSAIRLRYRRSNF